MKIAIGADAVGFTLKEEIKKYLDENGYEYTDFGVNSEEDDAFYANIAEKIALKVRDGNYDRGLLFCGTGIGVAITANKVPGIYATVCHDPFSAERASLSNAAQIITMGKRVIGAENAKVVLRHWLDNTYIEGSKSQSNIDAVKNIEKKYKK